ncbi:unnamed protein product [Brassica rapa]|uniref:Uncharacterized protein n=1 Tax=Brassica campestris TaxID=3711 RepID=A0A8D9GB85_BRACM|nr:unnamed protein product [Brassica rapa]
MWRTVEDVSVTISSLLLHHKPTIDTRARSRRRNMEVESSNN